MSLSALVDVKFSHSAIYCYGEVLTQIFSFFFSFQNLTKGVKIPLIPVNLSGHMIAAQLLFPLSSLCVTTVCLSRVPYYAPQVPGELLRPKDCSWLQNHTLCSYLWPDAKVWLILAQTSSLWPEMNFSGAKADQVFPRNLAIVSKS